MERVDQKDSNRRSHLYAVTLDYGTQEVKTVEVWAPDEFMAMNEAECAHGGFSVEVVKCEVGR